MNIKIIETGESKKIGPDTPLYSCHAEFAGYTWLDGLLGDQSISAWADADVSTSLPTLCEWLSGQIGEGYYLTARDVYAAYGNYEDADKSDIPNEPGAFFYPGVGEAHCIAMTPREMLTAIINAAN